MFAQKPKAREDRSAVLGSVRLPVQPESAGIARGFVRRRLDNHNVTAQVGDTMALLVSELVGNTVRHSRDSAYPYMLVEVSRRGSMLRLEVHDGDRTMPIARDTGEDDESGRGLLVVAALTSRWGAVGTPRGKYVFCEVPMAAGSAT